METIDIGQILVQIQDIREQLNSIENSLMKPSISAMCGKIQTSTEDSVVWGNFNDYMDRKYDPKITLAWSVLVGDYAKEFDKQEFKEAIMSCPHTFKANYSIVAYYQMVNSYFEDAGQTLFFKEKPDGLVLTIPRKTAEALLYHYPTLGVKIYLYMKTKMQIGRGFTASQIIRDIDYSMNGVNKNNVRLMLESFRASNILDFDDADYRAGYRGKVMVLRDI